MDERSSTGYGVSAGVALANALAHAGLYVFETQDAQRLAPSGIEKTRVPYLLKVLTDAGWLVRLRRDLYAGTGRLPGGVDIPPFVIATSLVTPSAISHWSALAHHDLTDQTPLVVTATTTRRVVTPSICTGRKGESRHVWHVAGIDCRYVTVIPQRFGFGIDMVWLDERFRVPVTDRERTVLDLFAMPRHFGGVGEGLAVLDRALAALDLERLVGYALRYQSTTLAKRLGWSLERAGVEIKTLMPLLELPAVSYSLLDPGRPRRGEHDRRWKLIVNIAADDDRG